MQATAESAQAPQMVHTRPRGQAASSGKHPVPPNSGTDPLADTQLRRAVGRSTPTRETKIGIVVTGDNHLSAALPGYPAERAAERRARLRAGFSAAVDYALQHGARLFVIAGDLFDTPVPGNADRAFVAGELARLRRANVVCVGVSGMSDSPRPSAGHTATESPYATYAALDSLSYFPATTTLAPRLLTLGDLHLAVVGVSTNPAAPAGSDPLVGVAVSDPEGVLSRADIGLLIVHAGVEGFARPADEERILTRATLEALPTIVRIVVAGHVHRFGRAHVGEREIIVPGSTERMDFDSQPGSSGFAWLEVGAEGLSRVKRIAVVEQPRSDVELSTARLFAPAGDRDAPSGRTPAATIPIQPDRHEAGETVAENSFYRIPALPVRGAENSINGTTGGPIRTPSANGSANGDTDLRSLVMPEGRASKLLDTVQSALDQVATEDTLMRLRLVGPISREQYHQLPLARMREYGARHAFAFELNTSGLRRSDASTPLAPSGSRVQRAPALSGPLTPAAEVERLLSERLAQAAGADPTATADLHAAAQILLARLQGLQGLQGLQTSQGIQGPHPPGGSQDREV